MSRSFVTRLSGFRALHVCLCAWFLSTVSQALAQVTPAPATSEVYPLAYDVRVVPSEKVAYVTIGLSKNASLVQKVVFLIDPQRHSDFDGDGELLLEDRAVTWMPPTRGGELRYTFRIDHLRDEQRYDALITSTWALFRGDDLVPPARVSTVDGSVATATLRLRMPEGWSAVTPYDEGNGGVLSIENPERRFDRPTGWFLLGKLHVAKTTVAGSKVTFATPRKQGARRQDLLAFLRWTLPELRDLAGPLPPRLTIVSAGDPMWRGGLSGPASLYLHAERPLIDDDFTSPVLHELLHTMMAARAGSDGDWVVEGLAELYSIEVLHRSRGISKRRYERAFERARRRAEGVSSLRVGRADGRVTAKAVGVLKALDGVMRERCKRNLTDVVKQLKASRAEISTASFRSTVESVGECDLQDFFAEHAPEPAREPLPKTPAAASPAPRNP